MSLTRIRRQKNSGYTIIANEILMERNISLKAKGLFATVMGLPSTWNFSVEGIAAVLKEGDTAIRAAIHELIEGGYCHYERERRPDGTLGEAEYVFTEVPQRLQGEPPNRENPDQVNSDQENRPLYNKQEIKETKDVYLVEPDPDPAVGEEPLPPGEPPAARKPDPVVEVFDYWVVKMGKSRAAKLTSDRRQKVKARLREGYTVEQIKQAIDGCSVDPFYMGDNVSGKTYNDLTLICRTGSKIEEFIERAEGPFAQKPQASLPSGTDLTLPSRSTWADLQEVMALDAEINGNWAPFLDPVAYRKAAGEYAARGPVEKAEVDEYENSPAYVKRFDIAPF